MVVSPLFRVNREPSNALGLSRGQIVLLALAMTVATLLRAYPYFGMPYPAGGDYGHHLQFADGYRTTGHVPVVNEYFQRGLTHWAVLPGAGMIYALLASFAGRSAFDVAPFTALTGALECAGVFLLARRLFSRSDAAVLAALIVALFPAGPDMIAWAGYANLLVIALLPFVLLSWLRYWDHPSPSSLAITVTLVCGTAAIHHFSTLWLGLILSAFTLVMGTTAPRASAGKIAVAVGVGLAVGIPVLSAALKLAAVANAAGVVLGANPRFEVTRIDWIHWDRVASTVSLALLGGLFPVLRQRFGTVADRWMLLAHLGVCALFGWGWLVGINFSYYRALYFLGMPTALAGAALVISSPHNARSLLGGLLVVALGLGTAFRLPGAIRYYSILTPDVVEGLGWLERTSGPRDVVAVGSFLGFHAPRLLRRATIVAMPPHQVGNPEELPLAADAMIVLSGAEGLDGALDRQSVRWIVITANDGDTPRPKLSLDALATKARLTEVFRNDGLVVFHVAGRQ